MTSWDSEKLWLKAKLFIDRANEQDQSSPEIAFWTALSLECLARSALTFVHPALNADPREDTNLLYGFGYNLTAKPRCLPAHSVYLRLEKIIKGFGQPQRELCEFVALQRNAHLHTADLPFDNLSPTKWLPRFYDTIKVLNAFIGKEMIDFVGPEIAQSAVELIKSLNDELIGAVKSKIAAHKKVFEDKPADERDKLLEAAKAVSAFPGTGEKIEKCPSCGAAGLLLGTKVKEFPEKYEDGELTVDVQFLASGFKCTACGLA